MTQPPPPLSLAPSNDSPLPSPTPLPPLDGRLVAAAIVESRRQLEHRLDVQDGAIEHVRELVVGEIDLAVRRHELTLAAVGRNDAKIDALSDEVRAGFRHLTHRDSQHDEGLEAARAEAAKAHTIATDANANARRALIASAKALAIGVGRVTAIVALLRGLLWLEQHFGLFR